MSKTLKNLIRRLCVAAGVGVGAALFVASPLTGQEKVPPAADDAVEEAKETAKDVKEDAKDTAKDVKEDAKDTVKDVKDDAKDTAGDVKDAAKDTTKDVRDTAKGAAKDTRDTVKGARETTRETVKGARETTRETVRGARDSVRETTRETSRSIESFRVQDVRPADFGIWFNRSTTNGLVINDISTRGPIAKLGFREGDRIISVNGQKVVRDADFVQYLFADDVRNDRVEVIVFRGGKQVIVYVQPIVLIQDYYAVQVDPLEQFGVILDDRYTDRIVIWRVVPRSPAYYAGIRPGDVFVSFRGQRLASPDAFVQLVQKVEPGNVAVEVMRDKQTRQYEVELPRVAARAGANVDVDVERPNERREGRIEERREERKEDRVEESTPPRAVPAVPAAPRPGILPRRPR